MNDTQKRALEAYKATGSIRASAKIEGINYHLARRYLIDAGVCSTPLIDKINDLFTKGRSRKEIVEILKISESAVSQYLPYSKGSYKSPPDPQRG